MLLTHVYVTLLANPTSLGSAGSEGPGPAVYTLHTLYKGQKNDLDNAFEFRFQGRGFAHTGCAAQESVWSSPGNISWGLAAIGQ